MQTGALPKQVVCAAIRNAGGLIVCGPRHHHCIRIASDLGIYESGRSDGWEQGFVNQSNEFMTRVEARALAEMRGQIQRSIGSGTSLFSEDLY